MSVKIVFHGLEGETQEVGPFEFVQMDDTTISTLDINFGEPSAIAEWAYGEGGDQGWVVEPPYGEDDSFYPAARVHPA